METVERYIYAVARRLPAKAREEVAIELRGLIEDLLEEKAQGTQVSKEHVRSVLMELGDPEDLAREYGGESRYLIGPRLFDSYLKILKIVGPIVLSLVQLALVIKAFVAPTGLITFIAESISALFGAGMHVFFWVTVAFAIADHFGEEEELEAMGQKEWTPDLLPEIPDKQRQISISDPLLSIGLSILFLVMYVMPQRFGVFQIAGSVTTVIPVVNPETVRHFLPLFIGLVGISIVKEVWKLAKRVWSGQLAAVSLICNGIAVFLAYRLFANPAFWNPDFVTQLLGAHTTEASEMLANLWSVFTTRFIYGVVIVYVIDSLWVLYRGFFLRRT